MSNIEDDEIMPALLPHEREGSATDDAAVAATVTAAGVLPSEDMLVDEPAVQPASKRQRRGLNWNKDEYIALLRAYVHLSCD
jgi:hypothetical protein